MSLSSEVVEQEYVHSIYSRLATYQQKTLLKIDHSKCRFFFNILFRYKSFIKSVPESEHHQDLKSNSPRIWPRVRQFVDQQPTGSVILDVGCGEAKYTSKKCHIIGFDTCPEILSSSQKPDIDLSLADAIQIPIKNESVDAILNVSVIHHFSTVQRRKQVLEECCRCLRVGGQVLIYVWAFEQPNGKFSAQDILVPWNMHEIPIAGKTPKVKFHMNSTKEQRVIAASIPVQITDTSSQSKACWYSGMLNKVATLTGNLPYFTSKKSSPLPSASPQFFPKSTISTTSIISGIRRWSPMIGKKLTSLLVPVEEQFGEEMAQNIMRESITEAMATLRDVTFYRYYHVFKEGELVNLVESIPSLRVISTTFEHGNWCVIAERIPDNYIWP